MKLKTTMLTAAAIVGGAWMTGCAQDSGTLGPAATKAATTPTLSASNEALGRRLYEAWFVRDGALYSARRSGAPHAKAPARPGLAALASGPSAREANVGVVTTLSPRDHATVVSGSDGVATVHVERSFRRGDARARRLRQAQVVYTLTQFPSFRGVRFVVGDGAAPGPTLTRRGMRDLLPPIVVDAPRPGDTTSSPLPVSGTANVFEATVSIRILDASGRAIARTFTTATCGSGCRGAFSTSVSYAVETPQTGTVEVFSVSAKDGEPQHLVAVPVVLTPSPTAKHDVGTWRRMAAAPSALRGRTLSSVWTGDRYIVLGQGDPGTASVAASYDPSADRWRRLSSPGKAALYPARGAIWTGRRMVVMNAFEIDVYDPSTDRWTHLKRGHGGAVAWTGRELVAWGGGCCGDARTDGLAFDPATERSRALPRAPLAGSQAPLVAWTGREILMFVGDADPDTGKPWPADLARAAAYDPATDGWRRIAPPPEDRRGASTAWDGHELLVVGGRAGPRRGTLRAHGLAFNPRTNRWRRLAPMPGGGRHDAAVVWTGKRLLVWGGSGGRLSRQTLAYDPATDRWSRLAPAPIRGRPSAAAVWTGRELIVQRSRVPGTRSPDGAILRLATP